MFQPIVHLTKALTQCKAPFKWRKLFRHSKSMICRLTLKALGNIGKNAVKLILSIVWFWAIRIHRKLACLQVDHSMCNDRSNFNWNIHFLIVLLSTSPYIPSRSVWCQTWRELLSFSLKREPATASDSTQMHPFVHLLQHQFQPKTKHRPLAPSYFCPMWPSLRSIFAPVSCWSGQEFLGAAPQPTALPAQSSPLPTLKSQYSLY